ncbi:hypothetical protein A4H97_09515 [Niastella yeongjuensis]|uniref:Uncharacterized protein n=1 Tax=Niastella yeongjuensis TaxID=354355 RepID=A0A1V9EEQ4_9BACT|nr:hypothetical protein A4H97_09515 [Niastella yeongjuensis]
MIPFIEDKLISIGGLGFRLIWSVLPHNNNRGVQIILTNQNTLLSKYEHIQNDNIDCRLIAVRNFIFPPTENATKRTGNNYCSNYFIHIIYVDYTLIGSVILKQQ